MIIKNNLYIITKDKSLGLEKEKLVIRNIETNEILDKIPLIYIESIILQGYIGISTYVMHKCIENNITIVFVSEHGKFLARVCGDTPGNVLTHIKQYEVTCNKDKSLAIAKKIIEAKVLNQIAVLDRAVRNNSCNDKFKIEISITNIKNMKISLMTSTDSASAQGIEGVISKTYFNCFDNMIVKQKDNFEFKERSRRPPLNNVNSMLSYMYTLLYSDVHSALSIVGLDPYLGILHGERSGRASLALDLMEELRPILVDKTVLKLINKNMVHANDFEDTENNGVVIKENAKRVIINEWNNKKKVEIEHNFKKERILIGQIAYTQASILSKVIRGELSEYTGYIWR